MVDIQLRPGVRDYPVGHPAASLHSASLVTKTHGQIRLNPSALRLGNVTVLGVPEKVQFENGVLSIFPAPTFLMSCSLVLQYRAMDRRKALIVALRRRQKAIVAAAVKRNPQTPLWYRVY